jgi:phenylpyruvate tautomerase PptA (4-oxalocrotonate tautomerase family)
MPVISIKTLPLDEDEVRTPDILKKLCTTVSQELNYKPSHVWATWEYIAPHLYAVGNYSVPFQPQSTHAPLVRVLAFEGRSKREIDALLHVIARVLAQELKVDLGNIFIEYAEARSGKLYDGGQVVY